MQFPILTLPGNVRIGNIEFVKYPASKVFNIFFCRKCCLFCFDVSDDCFERGQVLTNAGF